MLVVDIGGIVGTRMDNQANFLGEKIPVQCLALLLRIQKLKVMSQSHNAVSMTLYAGNPVHGLRAISRMSTCVHVTVLRYRVPGPWYSAVFIFDDWPGTR
jgi:hypothetical protein